MITQRLALLALGAVLLNARTTWSEVVINEIHYDPPEKTELAEFIELHNSGSAAVNLGGWRLSGGVSFTFPADTILPAAGYLVVAENPAAFTRKFNKTALGPWEGLLANDGERISLRNTEDRVLDEVTYQLGFPWPTVGEPPGYSIELVNPALDNDLGGSWRASVKGNPEANSRTLVNDGDTWKYQKGNATPSSPVTAWRELAFDDSSWAQGATPLGYDSEYPMRTTLADMRGSYTSVFLRKKITVDDLAALNTLTLDVMYDDGFKLWINGKLAAYANLPTTEVAYDGVSSGGARESQDYQQFTISAPATFLRPGENLIAIQLQNVSLANSSDCFVDVRLAGGLTSTAVGPTPGALNAAFDTNIPPHIRQVEHSPQQPITGDAVRITAKITDSDGVGPVQLQFQVVDPGSYVQFGDEAYQTNWTSIPMNDVGASGDLRAGDDVFTALLPGSLQIHRRLVRYRIVANDAAGLSIRAPYLDDPQPNFAYFVYDGVPTWTGAARPGTTPVERISGAEMGRLPVYHLIAKRASVEEATWTSRYTGDLYRWWGTLVYNGKVYDHIRYRARGGGWRYAMGKNMWKFDFNRGHDFQASDNYGEKYATRWRKLNLGANIQQGDYQHRGEQGMFESLGFRLFNLADVESPKTHWTTFRVVDEADEANPTNQFRGDFWGLYLAVEQEDGRFLDEHQLPDGNLYKMENYDGELNNQGRTAATDKSDLSAFTGAFRGGTQTAQWWRNNFDVAKYFSYQATAQAIHHYDICFGKNYFYYLNPANGKWSVHTWDLDLTWADNMYEPSCSAADEFKNRVAHRADFNIEYKNRVRELRDILFNSDQAWQLIDEYAAIVKGTNAGPNILAADRAMWDYNPVMVNSAIVNPGKAGQGLFYRFPLESASDSTLRGSFDAVPRIMKNYVTRRAAVLDALALDNAIPARPEITYVGPASYPVNRLSFRASPFNGTAGFEAMKWRVGEVRKSSPGVKGIYEIEPVWESPELTSFSDTASFPADALRVGHTYRARLRMKDTAGRWSNWSAPVEFLAGEPDNATALIQSLRITEIMYNPAAGNSFEFIELRNASESLPLQLAGASFTEGIDFTFPSDAVLGPGEYAVLTRIPAAEFRAHYGLGDNVKLFGPYSGGLNDDGEKLTLKTATAGTEIASFSFKDRVEWPIAADGPGHSLTYNDTGTLGYGRNWRASSRMGGTPGRADISGARGVVINELNAHTDYSDPARPEYDSNDWIELYNTAGAVNLADYYLSDDSRELKKWRLPSTNLAGGALITFDEINHFHAPITIGFGLNKAGEELYLSYLPGTTEDRVVDAVRFKGQASGDSWGRFPDGSEFLQTLVPSRDQTNRPAPRGVVISEIMYRPKTTNNVDETWPEFVELYNPSSTAIALANTNGGFRLDGAIAYIFATNATLPAGGVLVVVSFDPSVAAEKNRFLTHFGIGSSNIVLSGPFTGKLGNSSDRVALEKAEAPDAPGEPISWAIVDESIYTSDSGANGNGESLTRVDLAKTGTDPANQRGASPTPGWIASPFANDRDGDGLPDEWEAAHGLNPTDPTDGARDLDADGLSNFAEYLAGTDPRNALSSLRLSAVERGDGVDLRFEAATGKSYTIQYRTSFSGGAWLNLRNVTAAGPIEIHDGNSGGTRYYRVITPAAP